MVAFAMEVESVSERRRCWHAASAVRCALVLGACALLGSLVALTLILVRPQESPEAQPPRSQIQPPRSQTCAQLVLNGSSIENRRLKWFTSTDVESVIFSQEFDYDNDSGMLKIKSEGMYHIYAQMTTKRLPTGSKEQVNVTLIIHHKTAHNSDPILTLNVHLYPTLNEKLSASMGVLFPLKENDLLHVTLTASTNSSESTKFLSWNLENRDTIFRVSKIPGNSKSQVTENNDVSSEDKSVKPVLMDGSLLHSNCA